MDRIGLLAMGAAFVLASAFHMMGAPLWLVAVPVALFVVGGVGLLLTRETDEPATDRTRSTATEA